MERRVISSGSSLESRYGYSRAVVAGSHVSVAGTAPIMPGDADPPATAYEQAKVCLGIIERALAASGASLDDVVRTRVFLTDAGHAPEVMRAHGETFGEIRPACTAVVAGLLDPRWHVELELEAIVGEHR
jgi:enamine deaminase RidA (YjgF/YER057c/UK114 family)